MWEALAIYRMDKNDIRIDSSINYGTLVIYINKVLLSQFRLNYMRIVISQLRKRLSSEIHDLSRQIAKFWKANCVKMVQIHVGTNYFHLFLSV